MTTGWIRLYLITDSMLDSDTLKRYMGISKRRQCISYQQVLLRPLRKSTQNRASERGSCWIEVQLFKGQRKTRENNLLCKDKVERESGGRQRRRGGGQRREGGCGRSSLARLGEREGGRPNQDCFQRKRAASRDYNLTKRVAYY